MDRQSPARRNAVTIPEGVEIRQLKTCERLRVSFRINGQRYRETLDIPVTPANIKYAANLLAEIKNDIERGRFDYTARFPNSRHAKALHQQQQAEAKAESDKRITVGQLLQDYIDIARKSDNQSPASIATYVRWRRARIVPKWGETWLDELTTPALRQWIADLSTELAPKSVRNVVGLLRTVVTQAYHDKRIPENPFEPIIMRKAVPMSKKSKKKADSKVDPFNDKEIAAILTATPHPASRALFQFAFASGLRTGELIALKWAHIDFVNGLIHVQDNVVSAEIGTVEKTTKTDSERDIPILPAAREALAAMKPISSLLKIGDYVFVNQHNKRWVDERQIRTAWTYALKLAGVRYRNPYQTRHTFASRLLMAGEPEKLVADLLGHTTTDMVRKHYEKWIKQPEGVVLRGDYSGFGKASFGPISAPRA